MIINERELQEGGGGGGRGCRKRDGEDMRENWEREKGRGKEGGGTLWTFLDEFEIMPMLFMRHFENSVINAKLLF